MLTLVGVSMEKLKPKVFAATKYLYLIGFFALLAAFFNPMITGRDFTANILGVLILFLGLAGGVLLYKSIDSEKYQMPLLVVGSSLLVTSLFFIFKLAGRI